MSYDLYEDTGKMLALLLISGALILTLMAGVAYLTYNEKVQSCSEEGLKYSNGKCWEYSGSRVITYELQMENQWAFIPEYKVNKFPSVEN